jgi:hypothetical protein
MRLQPKLTALQGRAHANCFADTGHGRFHGSAGSILGVPSRCVLLRSVRQGPALGADIRGASISRNSTGRRLLGRFSAATAGPRQNMEFREWEAAHCYGRLWQNMTGGTMAHADQYFLGHSSVEQRRLQQQAEELAEESAQLFDRIGLAQGSRVVEIGCGPQGCLELLSSRVGPTGSVVGVELSHHAVQLAREFLSERRINNVEVRQGHAADTGLPRESFDLATARLVLVNIPEPERLWPRWPHW